MIFFPPLPRSSRPSRRVALLFIGANNLMMSSSSSSSSTSSASDSDSGGRHGDAANPSSAKRQKILVDKKVLRTSAMLLKQKMLSHDSIAKAKRVYANQQIMVSQPDKIAEWYCEFMVLKIMQGDYDASTAALSPGGIVDEFWHAHCLDTAGYANFFKDANPPGGEMVHHDALKSQDSAEMIGKRQDKTRAVSHWSY